jgi:3-dehydroquinate synthase
MTPIRISPPVPPAPAYDVHVSPGAVTRLAALVREAAPAERYAFVTDDLVKELHGMRVLDELRQSGLSVDCITFPAGEPFKTIDTWRYVLEQMGASGIGRDGCVIAFGGGVVGDLAGFAAATYMRGIPCVQVPTTLLAMLDASVGGKTAVDTSHGKNAVGAFHQPAAVIMDPSLVWTQERADLIAGAAEAVKHGAIADADYLEWIVGNAAALGESDTDVLTALITRSVEIKAGVVNRDPLEQGERAILNFGHTIGHALEVATHYRMSHGHAVARGMIAEAALGESFGVTAAGTALRLTDALTALGLPCDMPADLDAEQVMLLTAADKKARKGRPHYVLLQRIGHVARPPDGSWTWDMGITEAG